MFGIFQKNKKNDRGFEFWASKTEKYIISFSDLNLWNKEKTRHILKNVNFSIRTNTVTGIIGPSGSGKSCLLKCINKSNFDDDKYIHGGRLMYKNIDIFNKRFSTELLRIQIGMVFQKPILFPMSIKENLIFAMKAHGIKDEKFLNEQVEKMLKQCHLWDELKDRLDDDPAATLSGGQQQRLCIARAIAMQPDVLLMDEPTSSLDPKSTAKIEELIIELAKTTTVVLVSHSMSQVKRVSEYTLFLKNGEVIEYETTRKIFTNPEKKDTKDFVSFKY